MASRLSARERQPDDSTPRRSPIESPLRALLQQVGEPTGQPDGEREVLLETTIDGTCYQLVRVPCRISRAPATLSPRESEIVRLVAKGLPNKAIAEVLDLSLWTVATHLRRVFSKLGVNSRSEMVAYAITDGLLVDHWPAARPPKALAKPESPSSPPEDYRLAATDHQLAPIDIRGCLDDFSDPRAQLATRSELLADG